MTYYKKDGYILIRRHWIVLVFNYLKFSLFLFFGLALYYVGLKFQIQFGSDFLHYIIFPLSFISINYAFVKLLLYYIRYYNDLIILNKDQLLVIKTSLFDMDNIEVLELGNISKLDTKVQGLAHNLLGYGSLVVEQQRDRVREFHYIKKPYKAVNYIKQMRKK